MPTVPCPRCGRPATVSFLFAELVFTCPNCQARFYPLRPQDPVPDEPEGPEAGGGNRNAQLSWAGLRPRLPWLAVGALFLAAAAVTVTSWSPGVPWGGKASARKYTAEELDRLVLGKSKAEVLGLLGRQPNRTATYAGGAEEVWEYFGLVVDPVAGQGRAARIHLRDGFVERVEYR
jgi:hypothetical protein